MGGFECSTHKLRDGRRLDLIAGTHHDRHAAGDYTRLRDMGMHTCRDGVRWHLIESRPGHYDFSSLIPMLRSARSAGIQVIWDIFHYGYPQDIDMFSPAFVERFAAFARETAKVMADESDPGLGIFICPTNEVSFLSWAGGDEGFLNPFATKRGPELKAQLVRANIACCEVFWELLPATRVCQIEPVIHIIAQPDRPQDSELAENYRLSQYETWDMLQGRMRPDLGGAPKYLDIIGVNYYHNNQWMHEGPTLDRLHPLYKRFRYILQEVWNRYRRPMLISETGIEGPERPAWLEYVCGEARAAMRAGVDLRGLCWYPILNYPGWEDNRHCYAGLWDYASEDGKRELYLPLSEEYRRQMQMNWSVM